MSSKSTIVKFAPVKRPDGKRTEESMALTIQRRNIRIGHIVMGGRF